MFRLALAGLFLLIANSAQASDRGVYFYTGNQLYQACTSGNQAEKGVRYGYAVAVVDRFALDNSGAGECVRASIPEGVTQGQIKDIVIKYLNDNPEKRNWMASVLVVNAIIAAFPCQK